MIQAQMIKKILAGKKILVDTNVIIYLTDAIPLYANLSRQLFEMIEGGDISAVFSIASIAEVMQGLIKKGDSQTAAEIKTYLLNFPNALCQDITPDVLEKIGNDRRVQWSRLRTIDSLIVASGLVNGVGKIVSNDSHFRAAISEELFFSFDGKS
jgi:predicted nucleic acid-binding protein